MNEIGGDCAVDAAQAVLRGDRRAAAKLITRIESGDETIVAALRILYSKGAGTPVVGITGPPGAGKSTLVDRLIARYRAGGERVAVLAIDPSSPFTGGAILGDRVRMTQHSSDSGVFLRSMAARGRLGGLAVAAGDALTVFDAMGLNRILVETVGVGQSEIDILRHAQTVLIVQTPAGGDAIQAVKAGLIEVGDIFVVNKADNAGADRMVAALRESVEFRHGSHPADCWRPPIIKTQASDGVGIDDLIDAIEAHRRYFADHPEQWEMRRRLQTRELFVERIADAVRQTYRKLEGQHERLEFWLDEILARRCDPHAAATAFLENPQRTT
jgi:LAO/AO transport system kinase